MVAAVVIIVIIGLILIIGKIRSGEEESPNELDNILRRERKRKS